jgi:hypothetical protein
MSDSPRLFGDEEVRTPYNWLKTVGQDGWFVIFRLYAPTQPFFDKAWALPDFETI